MLSKASSAVTVKEKTAPATEEGGAERAKWVAVAGLSLIAPDVPVIALSAAVIVRLPAVGNVALNVAVPLVRVLSVGTVAAESLLVKWAVPPYAVTVLSKASSAVTVKAKLLPAVAEAGTEREKCVGAEGATSTWFEVPPVVASLAVMVWLPDVGN